MARQLEEKRVKYQQSRLEIEHKRERMIRHVKNQSSLIKKKYQDLMKLMDRSLTPVNNKKSM